MYKSDPRLPFRVPNEERKFIQTNRSDVLGNVVGTFNIDLESNLGKARTTRMVVTTTTADDANFTDYPVRFVFFRASSSDKIWTVAGARVFSNSGTTRSPFTLNTTSGTPTNCASDSSDIETFNNSLYVTGGTSLYKLTSSTVWSTNATGISGGNHALCAFGNRLYITKSGDTIISMDTSDVIATSGQYTLDLNLDINDELTFIRAASNKIWIGTVSSGLKTKGYVYEWDGSSTQATRSYRIEGQGALACVIKDDIPYVMDSNGRLLMYSSGSFKEIARLPLNNKLLDNALTSSNSRFIHPNGMSIINGRINLLIKGVYENNVSSSPEFCPSGIWEYDDINNSLYHKYSASYTPVGTTTVTDYGQNKVFAVGGLTEMKLESTSIAFTGTFMAGIKYYTDATTATTGVLINDEKISDPTQRSAYIVTVKLESSQVTEMWQTLFLKYKKFLTSTDKIIAKYRIDDPAPIEATITWTSTTTFTTTTDVSSYWTSGTGGEVEVLQGKGSGLCSHITSIVNNAGTYTVTVDETYTGATSGTAIARFQNWTKVGSINNQTSQWEDMGLPTTLTSPWIQFKIVMIFTDMKMEFDELLVQSKNSLLAINQLGK